MCQFSRLRPYMQTPTIFFFQKWTHISSKIQKRKTKTKTKNLFKVNRFLYWGHLQGSSSIWQGSSSKIVNWMRGQRSNKSLILIPNIANRNKKPTYIFLRNIKLLFDIWPLIQFTIFEEEAFKIEEKSCKCPSVEESIHFEEVFFFFFLEMHFAKGYIIGLPFCEMTAENR